MDISWFIDVLALPPSVEEMLARRAAGNSILQYVLVGVIALSAWLPITVAWRFLSPRIANLVSRLKDGLGQFIVSQVRAPVCLSAYFSSLALGTFFFTRSPTATDPTAHHMFIISNASMITLSGLCIVWLISRLVSRFWRDVLVPAVENMGTTAEARLLPILYRTVLASVWILGTSVALSVAGIDAVGVVQAILAWELLKNSLYQYLTFIFLSLLFLGFARIALGQAETIVFRFLRERGVETEQVSEDWLSDLNFPLLLLFITAGGRVSSEVLTGAVEEGTLSVYEVVATSLDVVLVLVLTWGAYLVSDKLFTHVILPLAESGTYPTLHPKLVSPTRTAVLIIIGLVGVVFLIMALGRDPATVLAGMGIGGLAIGLAARDTLSPLISGIVIYLTKPYTLGDLVLISDKTEGTVVDIGIRATTLRTLTGVRVIVPNDAVITSTIQNRMSATRAQDSMFLRIDIATVPEKRDETMALFRQVILDTPNAYEPEVYFLDYGADNLGLMLTYWVDEPQRMYSIRTQVMLLIDTRLREIGVEMSLPTAALNFHGYLPGGGAPTVQILNLPPLQKVASS